MAERLKSDADIVVREMLSLGAVFELEASAAWSWRPSPEDMRLPIRRCWRQQSRAPSAAEMVRAIQRAEASSC